MPDLVVPFRAALASLPEAWDEFAAAGENAEQNAGTWGFSRGELSAPDGWERLSASLAARRDPDAARPEGFVPDTCLWWCHGNRWLGRVSIRHRLTPQLLEVGVTSATPFALGTGHATAILAATLPVAAGLGIDPALVTCSVGNEGSRRTIERNGGILEDQRGQKLRYWIATGTTR